MSIDWFTVLAQFINFFILLWLLKYFLYGPIMDAIDSRETRIQERFEKADAEQQKAHREKESYQEQNQELQQRRESILEEAREEAEDHRQNLIRQARQEVDALRERWEREIQREKDQFLKDLREQAGEAVQDQVSRVLRTLADDDLNHRTVRVFLERLREVPEEERREFLDSVDPSDGSLRVLSSIGLPDDLKDRVRSELCEVFDRDFNVDFEVDEDLVAGLEVEGDGRKIGWSVRDVLDRIERRVLSQFEAEVLSYDPTSGGLQGNGSS